MSAVALYVLVLGAGWLFIRAWLRTRYRALKDAGHPQYFSALVASAYLLAIGCSVHVALSRCGPLVYGTAVDAFFDAFPASVSSREDSSIVSMLAASTVWALVLARPLAALFNWPLRNSSLRKTTLIQAGALDAIEATMENALSAGISIAVTLKSGKVYVGLPAASSTLDDDRKWIALFPIMSGFRTATGKIKFTTDYNSAYSRLQRGLTEAQAQDIADRFRVLLPIAEISVVQSFDLEIYEKQFRSSAIGETGNNGIPPSGSSGTVDVEDNKLARGAYSAFIGLFSMAILAAPHSGPAMLGLLLLSALCCVLARNPGGWSDSVSPGAGP